MEPMVGFAVFFGLMALAAFSIAFVQHREKCAEKIAENTDALEETDTKVHTDVRLRNVPTSRLKKRTKYMTTVQGHIGIGISLAFMVPLLLTLNDIFFWLAFGSAAVTAIFLFVQWARKNSVKGTIRK